MVGLLELLSLIGVVLGTVAGSVLGFEMLGVWGALGGGLASLWVSGRLALGFRRRELLRIRRLFRHRSTEDLHDEVMGRRCMMPNVALLELGSRGVDLGPYLGGVLELLESKVEGDRIRGWAALASAYPGWAENIPGYPSQIRSLPACREKAGHLRVLLRGAAPEEA